MCLLLRGESRATRKLFVLPYICTDFPDGLRFLRTMTTPLLLACDGCGQSASPAHLARRLQRLEWTTRYRPVHIQALLLGGIAPEADAAFLYCPEGNYQGEAANLLDALRISRAGRSVDAVLTDFQKGGFLLTQVLECPLEPGVGPSAAQQLIERQLPVVIARLRRSLKPKRVVLFSRELTALAGKFKEETVGSPVFTGSYGPFSLDGSPSESEIEAFRRALPAGSLL
jgi:hypothetical protein